MGRMDGWMDGCMDGRTTLQLYDNQNISGSIKRPSEKGYHFNKDHLDK